MFYHGTGHWTAPLSLAEMVETPAGTGDPVGGFAYTLRDLGRIPPDGLPQAPDVLAGLLALREVFRGSAPDHLPDMITGGPVDGSAFERHILLYITERMDLTPEALGASLQRTKPQRWETLMGTVAQTWMREGRAEGKAEGRAEGAARVLIHQLERRFGRLPAMVRDRVRGATTDDLEAWADAVLDAESLDAVFARVAGA